MQSSSVQDASDFQLPFMAAFAVLMAGMIGGGGTALAIALSCFILIRETGTAVPRRKIGDERGLQIVQVFGGAK